ncbi:MAG: PKD domain-containing protein, partial [Methanoregula sp.]|nr:PKD domain-containing protein [Methanoregula sp.]
SIISISPLYPGYTTVTAKINNSGTLNAGAFKANITIDGNATVIEVPGLAAGSSTTISATDTVWRRYNQAVPVEVRLDTENAIAETDESNNQYTATVTVTTGCGNNYYCSGRSYIGSDLETTVYTEGHVGVAYSTAGIGYGGAGTVTYTPADLPVPATAKILSARLYQSWTWYGYGSGDTVQFNGNPVQTPNATYFDPVDGTNGQVVFDVTPYFIPGSDNTAVITSTSSVNYGPLLVVVYEDESAPLRKIWVDEGSDSIYNDAVSPSFVAYAMFHNVNTTNMSSARMTNIVPSGDSSPVGSNEKYLQIMLMNGQDVHFAGTAGNDPMYLWYDVTGTVHDGTNEMGLPLQGAGDFFTLAVSILEVNQVTPSQADFTAEVTQGTVPLTIRFADTSSGTPATWAWDFGDGNTSTVQNPVHTYTAEGTYTVSLTTTNGFGSDTETKPDYIIASPTVAPVSAFSATPMSGKAPLAVQFNDSSANYPTSWAWDFGDGVSSSEKNPSHTYIVAGTYTVSLTVSNPAGSDEEIRTACILVEPIPTYFTNPGFETGDFSGWTSGSRTSIVSNSHSGKYGAHFDYSGYHATNYVQQNIYLTDVENISFWGYEVGGSNKNVSVFIDDQLVQSAACVQSTWTQYTVPTNYTGAHVVTIRWPGSGVGGFDIDDFSPGEPETPRPIANFTAEPTTGIAPLAVTFTDTSENIPTSWAWTFGDGSTSTVQHPVHTYASAGTYSVTLAATNAGGSNSTVKSGYITVTSTEPAPIAGFTTSASTGQVPFTVTFTDTTTGNVTAYAWDFGDGSSSTVRNPTHTYLMGGTYSVALTATGPGGSNSTIQSDAISVSAAPIANNYYGSIPLATVQSGTVSGGLWSDSYPGFATSASKSFTLPGYTDIKWARLYVVVYDGHMENNYQGNVSIGIDANGDST